MVLYSTHTPKPERLRTPQAELEYAGLTADLEAVAEHTGAREVFGMSSGPGPAAPGPDTPAAAA